MKGHQDCPFCGNEAAIDTLKYAGGRTAKLRAQCQKCGAATAWYDNEPEAWKAWDVRKTVRGKTAGRKRA